MHTVYFPIIPKVVGVGSLAESGLNVIWVALIYSFPALLSVFVAAGWLHKKGVLRSIKNIEKSTNHVGEGQPTLIQIVQTTAQKAEIVESKLNIHQEWTAVCFSLIANQIGVKSLPPLPRDFYEDK